MSDLSIIIPVYNRTAVLRYSLESVRRARGKLGLEVIVVDDGSDPAVDPNLAELRRLDARVLRQQNQGLLFARLAGLRVARGRHVLFLDSDDLVSVDKLERQVAAMDAASAGLSYTDSGRTVLKGDYDLLAIEHDAAKAPPADSAEFFILTQPAPHAPMFRRAYLEEVVQQAFFPPSPLYNSVAEIWFYHNAAPRPTAVIYVPGALAIGGQHAGTRLTNHWERLAVASLGVMEAFARGCPLTETGRRARELVAAKAFQSWRRLPRNFSVEFAERELALWRQLRGRPRLDQLGGRGFAALARIVGADKAGRLLRRWQREDYEHCRTISDTEFAALLSKLPPP